MAVFILATLFCVTLIFALNVKYAGMDSGAILMVFGNALDHGHGPGNSSLSLEKLLSYIMSGIAITIFFVSLFLSLFSVSSVYPEMLKKGYIDMLISKPISRTYVFFQRFCGAMTAVFINIFYIVIFSWLILSFKFGVWDLSFLISGFVVLLFFYNIFSMMIMISMFVKNSVIALLSTYFIVFILSPIIAAVERFGAEERSLVSLVSGFLNGILPKISETVIFINLLLTGDELTAIIPVGSILSGTLFLLVAVSVFTRTDF